MLRLENKVIARLAAAEARKRRRLLVENAAETIHAFMRSARAREERERITRRTAANARKRAKAAARRERDGHLRLRRAHAGRCGGSGRGASAPRRSSYYYIESSVLRQMPSACSRIANARSSSICSYLEESVSHASCPGSTAQSMGEALISI